MTERKELGKIESVSFGFGGYQGAEIGVSFGFIGDGWGCGDSWGFWAGEASERTQWSAQDRINHLGEVTMKIAGLLKQANKQKLEDLKGIPIEVVFDGYGCSPLKSWRILTEVL